MDLFKVKKYPIAAPDNYVTTAYPVGNFLCVDINGEDGYTAINFTGQAYIIPMDLFDTLTSWFLEPKDPCIIEYNGTKIELEYIKKPII